MTGESTVYVIDDDQAVRDSLQFLLESAGFSARTYVSAAAFLAEHGKDSGPRSGCLIVDLRLPGITGLDLLDELRQRHFNLPAVVITGHGDVQAAVRALKAGALDFIEKPFNDAQLLDCVRQALDRDDKHRKFRARRDEVLLRLARLTPRERQVMDLIVQGHLNKEIAIELEVSPKTVEVHRAHVMKKMRADSLAELVRCAVLLEESQPSA